MATMFIGAIGLMYSLDPTNTWGKPVVFFAIWMPSIHVTCKCLDTKAKWSFFNSPQQG